MATTITAATASAVSFGTEGPRQFQAVFDVIPFQVTLTDASIPSGAAAADITVTGADLGDFVLLTGQADTVDCHLVGWVASANTVTVVARSMEETDASTTFSGGIVVNGIVLKPKGPFASL